jgi:hypothetical protein
MAFKDAGVPDAEVLPTGFYNVSRAVGKGSANRKGDVMLVQLLLKLFYDKRKHPKPPGKMVVDGLYGPTTATWLIQYQLRENPQWPRGIATDGVVDRAKDPWFGSISETTYTILALNHRLRQVDPQLFNNLALDPMCPPILAGELLFNGPD